MTEQMVTNVGKATVKPRKEVLIQYGDKVTGSPQAIISLHADFREVAPQHGAKTPTEHSNEAHSEDAVADTAAHAAGFISELYDLYEFRDNRAVESFLEENDSLGDLLFEAHGVIREYFGSEVHMALEVVADPEALGDKQLFVLIRTESSPKVAREQLAELDKAWWLETLPATEGKMEVALD